jgi:hypothetical protein
MQASIDSGELGPIPMEAVLGRVVSFTWGGHPMAIPNLSNWTCALPFWLIPMRCLLADHPVEGNRNPIARAI